MAKENTYRNLLELSKSDYQIVGGEPNIIGWEVKNENGAHIGKVIELLFDEGAKAVRYMVIDLSNNSLHLMHKKVMIPIGLANLHISNDEVVLPNIHIDQFDALQAYDATAIGPDTEVYIRSVMENPDTSRIDEAISEFDQNEFYTHHHFDERSFYQRGRSNENLVSQEISGTVSMADRVAEEHTIHNLVEHSKHPENKANENQPS